MARALAQGHMPLCRAAAGPFGNTDQPTSPLNRFYLYWRPTLFKGRPPRLKADSGRRRPSSTSPWFFSPPHAGGMFLEKAGSQRQSGRAKKGRPSFRRAPLFISINILTKSYSSNKSLWFPVLWAISSMTSSWIL